MALPQQFLDELRARLTLSSVIGRRVKLIRAGREHKACCPFHNEKSPSFTVNDDKGFYHCFGCGAHGDVITFEMEAANLSFREAVEKLSVEAGLEVPRETREDQEQARKRAGVLEVVEAACVFFEKQLRMPSGKAGLDYLRRRRLDDATIARFRLGWAPGGGSLKGALAREGIDEDQLVEAGLLKRRDDGSVVEYFRERVMFPITDRRGRVIAFGGRTLGDGQPKYLNTPETSLFHKGQILYGLAQAREPAGRSGEIIVAEGYMDVIALSMAGFPQAVAPLGTALTESQIAELWKLADEPILCFDGDAAGVRAAVKGGLRALPLLTPGKSLRFALVPGGQDPDDLIRDRGPGAMRDVLNDAKSLFDLIWRHHADGHPVDTPERKAALEADLMSVARTIEDRTIQEHYRSGFKDRLWQLFRAQRPAREPFVANRGTGGGKWKGGKKGGPPAWSAPLKPPPQADSIDALRRRILLVTVITHPELFEDVAERLGALNFPEPNLDRLRSEVLMLLSHESSLDFAAVRHHLRACGCGMDSDSLLNSQVFTHASFSRPDADTETARLGWEQTYELSRRKDLKVDIDRAVERLGQEPTTETFESFVLLKGHERIAGED